MRAKPCSYVPSYVYLTRTHRYLGYVPQLKYRIGRPFGHMTYATPLTRRFPGQTTPCSVTPKARPRHRQRRRRTLQRAAFTTAHTAGAHRSMSRRLCRGTQVSCSVKGLRLEDACVHVESICGMNALLCVQVRNSSLAAPLALVPGTLHHGWSAEQWGPLSDGLCI